ncbi:MAG TPA: DASS family sodium-coupled anion symporter [Chitinophagaceae bacterium]|nr:DASS family sodium-coupled anion symporter [Chitinophagaceae bacterium]
MFKNKELLNWVAIITGVVLFFFFLLINPLALDVKAAKVLAVAALMISWWILEALPMPVVALVPIIFFPLMGIATLEDATAPYANSIVFLFMGGFMIGLAIEKWNLHKRIALSIVNVTGTSGNKIILGFILATGFLSMWLSNTATTIMMFPIAASVIRVMGDNNYDDRGFRNFSLCLMLAIAYASNFGGIATIIGTPPNVAFVGYIQKQYNHTVEFADWMLICTPLALLLMFSLYIVMVKILYPNHISHNNDTRLYIKNELKKLGPLSVTEKRVLLVFVSTALLWITKDLINKLHIIKLDDTIIAITGAFALFVFPTGRKEVRHEKLMNWEDTSKMAWGILLLFGGGITLANALEKAGLITMLGNWLSSYAGNNILLLVLMITIISVFISEVMSNVAQVIVFAPVIGGMANALKIDPLLLGVPMTLAASCASMLPMGTPPNAIVFASGHIRLPQMLKTGLVMNIISVILITLFSYFLLPKLMAGVR